MLTADLLSTPSIPSLSIPYAPRCGTYLYLQPLLPPAPHLCYHGANKRKSERNVGEKIDGTVPCCRFVDWLPNLYSLCILGCVRKCPCASVLFRPLQQLHGLSPSLPQCKVNSVPGGETDGVPMLDLFASRVKLSRGVRCVRCV